MGYTDQIECPHCKQDIEVEVDIEGYGDYAYAIINPLPENKQKGEENEVNMERINQLRDGSDTSQALLGNR